MVLLLYLLPVIGYLSGPLVSELSSLMRSMSRLEARGWPFALRYKLY